MGKVLNEMSKLATLINNTDDSGVSIDDIPTEIKRSPGRPKKQPKVYKEWMGMQVPGEIYSICEYIKNILIEEQRYTEMLSFQIYNASVQQYLYNRLISKLIEGRDPVSTRELTTTSEALRRALQSLGLTVTDKKSGVTKEQTEVNPLQAFLEKMEGDDEEEVVIKKPKKKGSK